MATQRIKLPITGMTCSACERNVDRALNRTEGVTEAVVNVATDNASVHYDPSVTNTAQLVQAVRDSGYGVATAKVELPITGMTCAMCEKNVNRALSRPAGVLDVHVNLATEKASITYVPGAVRRSDLIKAVEDAGYGVVDTAGMDAPDDAERKAREEEIQRQKNLVLIGAIFSVPLVILSMTRHLFHGTPFMMENLQWLMPDWWIFVFGALATPVQFILGKQYVVGAYKSLRNGTANMDVLVAMGSSAAYLYSVVIAAGVAFGFSDVVGTADYFESAAVILTLITLGKLLEARAKGRTSEAIKKLMNLAPDTAILLRDGDEEEIRVDEVVEGDRLVVKPGSRIPVDGLVEDGNSSVDESMLTGESMPVSKQPGAEVIGGTMNKQGRLIIEATRVGSETALAQIVRLVEEAQGSKAPIQRVADQVSGVFVPIVILLAIVTFFGWLLIGNVSFTVAFINTVAVLVIACPCALGLATPTAIMVGTGRGAEAGVLFKSSESLESAHRLQTIVLDKTGTITKGEPTVTDIVPTDGTDKDELLRLAAVAERGSEHPLGSAIVEAAQKFGCILTDLEGFEAVSGRGIRAQVEGKEILIGSPRFLNEENVDASMLSAEVKRLQSSGRTAVVVAVDGQAAGVLGIADTVKEGSPEAIAQLKSLGIETIMLTGDNELTAKAIAREVGIDNVIADVLPGDKSDVIRRLQDEGKIVAMVGDGINDAPALAQANVGIAIGTGTDIAMEASDVTLVSGDLRKVPQSIQLSKGTMRTIYQNLFWAFVYNIILIPVAMLGLLIPMFAAAAMAFSSFFVVTNSLRLRSSRLPGEKKMQRVAQQPTIEAAPAGAGD